MQTRGREPGDDDDLDEHVLVGELLAMFQLGFQLPRDEETDEAIRKAHAALARRRALEAAHADLAARGVLRRVFDAANAERRPCRLCGVAINVVGREAFDDNGDRHRATCARMKGRR